MCDNVVFHDGNEIAASQGNLASIIGRGNLVMDADAEYRPDDCLCPVNLAASAAKAGYEQSRLDCNSEYDPFDYHWRKSNDSRGDISIKKVKYENNIRKYEIMRSYIDRWNKAIFNAFCAKCAKAATKRGYPSL